MKCFRNLTTSRWLPVVVLFVITLLLTFGCGKKEPGQIKIGVILPLTGPMANGGNRVLNGIQLAVDSFNASSSRKVALQIEDSQAQPSIGVSAISKLIQVDRVNLIIGDLTSGVTLAMAPIAGKNKVVLLAPGASNPAVRNAGDYIFRNWVSDDFDGMVAASYLFGELGKKRVIVLYIQNDYGVGLKDAFAGRFRGLGGTIVYSEAFEQGQGDFRSVLAKVKPRKFDAIYIAGYPREMGFLVKQMAEYGVSSTLFSNASVEEKDFQTIAGNTSTGLYYTSPAFDLSADDSVVRIFAGQYENRYEEEPDIASAHGYDAARMLLHCIQEGMTDSDGVKSCLYSMKGFYGVTGTITIDENGDAIKGLLVKKFDPAGRVVTLQYYTPDG